MQLTRSAIAFCLVVGALFAPRGARGESAVTRQARSLYEQGEREYELGHFAEAASLYEDAYKLRPVPALLFNVAQCRRKMGDTQGALHAYRSFLRADPDHPSAPTARDLVEQLERSPREDTPAPQPVPAVVTTAPVVPPEALTETAPPVHAHKRWPALTAAGTAAAVLAFAVAESFAASSATDQLAQLHQQGTVSPADDARLRADAESKRARARTLYVISAVAAAAGVGLYFAF
jgi:tetratricopeptide (TPR) repeat protein